MTTYPQLKQDMNMASGTGRKNYIFTSEAVSEGHPDKVCDRISDETLDFLYEISVKEGYEWDVRGAVETFATTNHVTIGGEFRVVNDGNWLVRKLKDRKLKEEINQRAREAIKDIGYEQDKFHHATLKIQNLMHAQSLEIAQGVDGGKGLHEDEGAGDQGIMFGFATNETQALMPAPLFYSHAILSKLTDARKTGSLQGILGPDAKSQLSLRYEDGVPVEVVDLVVSHQHLDENLTSDDIRGYIEPYITDVIPDGWLTENTKWWVNPTGKFVIGGPDGDAGLTGRKIIVDNYGGAAPHGGGAFSGKDSTKVDRSAAYMARYLAKNIVAQELAEKCTIQLSYAIGVAQPRSVYVDTHGTGIVPDAHLEAYIAKEMNLRPRGIRETLDLNKPIYARTSSGGHFGRTPDVDGGFSWERTDEDTHAAQLLKNMPK